MAVLNWNLPELAKLKAMDILTCIIPANNATLTLITWRVKLFLAAKNAAITSVDAMIAVRSNGFGFP